MKKLISFSALCLTIVLSVQSVSAQGTTTLIMKDGTQQEGYLRSPFYSTIQYVDLSQSPTAKPRRYPIGEIDRIVMVGLDGDTVNYVREIRYRMFKSNSPDTKKEKGRYRMPVLFREDYRGKDGIALLTEFRETEQTTGLRTALGTSWTALVAAELLASSEGLGFMIQQARSISRPDIIIVGMICIGVVGLVLDVILHQIEIRVAKGMNAK